MNALADPYPQELAALDAEPIAVNQAAVTNRLVVAVNRLAQAVEQNTLALLDRPQNAPGPALASLPPVQTVPQAATVDVCPTHGTPWKIVPAGVSKKTGKPYESFRACSTPGCDQRPRL